jgi:hypothetical protein
VMVSSSPVQYLSSLERAPSPGLISRRFRGALI